MDRLQNFPSALRPYFQAYPFMREVRTGVWAAYTDQGQHLTIEVGAVVTVSGSLPEIDDLQEAVPPERVRARNGSFLELIP